MPGRDGEAESPDVWGRTEAMPLLHILLAGASHKIRPDIRGSGGGGEEGTSPWDETQRHLAEGQHAG